jgi:hypothetical protein
LAEQISGQIAGGGNADQYGACSLGNAGCCLRIQRESILGIAASKWLEKACPVPRRF